MWSRIYVVECRELPQHTSFASVLWSVMAALHFSLSSRPKSSWHTCTVAPSFAFNCSASSAREWQRTALVACVRSLSAKVKRKRWISLSFSWSGLSLMVSSSWSFSFNFSCNLWISWNKQTVRILFHAHFLTGEREQEIHLSLHN